MLKWTHRRPDQALERTATRRVFTRLMIKTVSVEAKLGDGGSRSACSRYASEPGS